MSSTKPAKENTALSNTRQMLDELDALMERMLALPVADLDMPADESAPRTGAPHIPVVRMPTVSATLTVLDAPTDQKSHDAEPAPEIASPSPNAELGAFSEMPTYQVSYTTLIADDATDERSDAPAREMPGVAVEKEIRPFLPPPEPIPEHAIPPSILSLPLPESVPPIQSVKLSRFRLGNLGLLPLVLVNAGFDRGTQLLGWPGRFLRSRAAKNLLGVTGLVLLAWASLWLLKDWLGWTW